jgi:hypothetical protein
MTANVEKGTLSFDDHKENHATVDDHQTHVERQNSVVLTSDFAPELTAHSSWLERALKPTKYTPRYPFVGKPLLWMTCAFGSLGDALFGYDQGTMISFF